jgi:pimeloyl-ACP methyl ester carboxylesterase
MRASTRWLAAAVLVAGALFGLRDRWVWGLPFVDPGPPPGQMVDVGGFRMHLVCEGEGEPTVVLDAGAADLWTTWFRVQPELARSIRVCSYDRAGIGYSEPGPLPRSRRRMVEELRTLLARAGVPPPYVLVGHSFGGLNARLYAALHPEEVAGLVLAESSHEDHWKKAPREFWDLHVKQMEEERQQAERARRGESMPSIAYVPDGMSLRTRRQIAAVSRRPAWYVANYQESLIAEEGAKAFTGLPRTLDIPLVVLSAGKRQRPERRSPELHERWIRIAGELQEDLASRSTRSRRLVVENAGHYIHWDRPDVVIEAALDLARLARDS